LGGAAVYSAVAASFYCEPCLVGVVGEDFRVEDEGFLRGRGIDLRGLQRRPGKTFFWAGRYHADMIGRETLDTQLNVFAEFEPVLPPEYRQLDYLFLANIHPGLQRRVLEQMSGPRLTVMDTMNLWINTAREELVELFPRVDVIVVNDEEARLLTGEYNIIRAAGKLLQSVKRAVIVKRGEHGSTLFTAEGMAIAPAYPVERLVDPTGAGDSFAGALIGALAQGQDLGAHALRQALLHGAAMASFTVEGFSLDRLRHLTPDALHTRIRAIKEMIRFD